MNRHFVTSKGTELPLLNLKGKDYLEVKYRLVWFREDHPSWSIETDFVATTEKSAFAKATVRDDAGRVIATSHKAETASGFPDFMEKAETGAIGRALALIGYGTQFCADELDEGDRIVDSPVAPRDRANFATDRSGSPEVLAASSHAQASVVSDAEVQGYKFDTYRISFGKFRGKRMIDIPRANLESYLEWLQSEADKKNSALSVEANIFKHMAELYFEKLDQEAAGEVEADFPKAS